MTEEKVIVNEETYRTYLEYEQYKALLDALQREYNLKRTTAEELKIASEELKKIPNKDGLIPLGPGFIFGKFEGKVLVPIGAGYYVAYTPEKASEKFSELARQAEEEAKQLYSKLQELLKIIATLEKKLVESQRGSGSARTSKESA